MKISSFCLWTAAAAALCTSPAEAVDKTGGLAPGQRPDIALYGSALKKYVRDDGRVDYQRLKAEIGPLAGFVLQLGAVSPDSQPALYRTRDAQLAY